MYVEGEVKHGRAGLEHTQLTRWSEDENLVLGRGRKVFRRGVVGVLKSVAHALQPGVCGSRVLDTFVCPVGGEAVFCHVVHAGGADLHLQEVAHPVLYGDVKGLVAAGARGGYPVAKAACVGLVFFCNIGIYLPAELLLRSRVFRAVYDEADGENVEYALERNLLDLHLAPDGPGALGAYLQFVPDAGGGELELERLYEFLHEPLAVFLSCLELVCDGAVLLRLDMAQVDVAEFRIDVVQAKLVRQGHIQHLGLEEFLVPGHFGEHVQIAHNLKTVCNLDDAHAGVCGIADYELLVVLCLKPGVFGLDGGDFVEAVYHHPDVLGKAGQVRSSSEAAGLVKVYCGRAVVREADFLRDYPGYAVGVAYQGGAVVSGLVCKCGDGDLTCFGG